MALSQQKFREIVFQLLYSYDLGRPNEAVMTELMMAELAVSKKNVLLAQEKVQKIILLLPEIDPLISTVSISYDFDRIQIVTKNILRLGVFELKFEGSIPPKIAIAEAIRLSRKFSTPESASFVNALLDNIYQDSLGDKGDPQVLQEKAKALEESEKASSELKLAEQEPISGTEGQSNDNF
ncbi:MAG: transcription antitermination factor NusB [Candidatus Protochlamydia sp.]|nr:transcription antitermination factor NusB [Candidatus Protochlamydia sp.]